MSGPTREDLEAIMNAPHRSRYEIKDGNRTRAIKNGKRKDPAPAGYAAEPGGGPAGETCGSCRHISRTTATAKTYLKCGLNSARWTGGRKTDILSRSPACARWVAPLEPEATR